MKFKILFSYLIITFFTSEFCMAQSINPSKFSFSLGPQYAIPHADIKLKRGSRKTVEHQILPSLGFSTDIYYQFRDNKYLFIALDLSSFEYKSKEMFFFNGAEYPATDQMLNICIKAGIGWDFMTNKTNSIFLQPSLVYIIHNSTLKDFPSERILPNDLNTINITTIDWDLFNTLGIGLDTGYRYNLNERWTLEVRGTLILSLIEGDIVDSPTSNDFDNKPNMSRFYIISSFGLNIRYKL